MSISNLYPTIAPSLSLDFANVKALDPRITFVRTTTATYYGTETAKAEENLLLRSQELDNAAWANTGTTDTANSTTAPDGTTTADTVTETTATSSHNVNQTFTPISGLPYVFSVFVKKGDGVSARNFVQLGFPNTQFGSNSFANFDIDSGTVTFTGAGLTSASIVSAGNDWYRCIIIDTAVASTAATAVISLITTDTAANQESYTGTTDANIFLWGCQLEQRSAVTAYTPTTTQAITNYIPVLEVAAAGEARFDHNPLTFESLGLLVEEQRTNLQVHSEEFDNAAWTKTRSSITANTIVAPDGTLTGDKLVEDTTVSSTHLVASVNITSLATTAYTGTFYAKAGERNFINIQYSNTSFGGTTTRGFINLLSGAVSSVNNSTVTATEVGNGWYRCSITATTTVGGNLSFIANLSTSGAGAGASYTGDGFSGIFLWGAQLEEGAFSTSYIPTVAATVTRNADVASMTGTNFSSWYRADEGTLYAEANTPSVAGVYIFADINSNSTTNLIRHATTTNGLAVNFVLFDNATTVANPSVAAALGSTRKMAGAYAVNSVQESVNGSLGIEDTNATIPAGLSQMNIGSRSSIGAFMVNAHIRKLSFYPARLSNAQLQALTTV